MAHEGSDTITIKIPKLPKDLTNDLRRNPWIVSTFVLGIFALVLLVNVFFGGSTFGSIVSPDVVGEKLVNFLNQNSESTVILRDVSLENGVYKVDVDYQGNIITLYTTTDGNFLIQNLVPLGAPIGNNNLGSGSPSSVTASEDDDAFLGNADAPVTIIEFSDYQCPFCRKFWRDTLPLLKSEYIDTGKVKFVYRDFPLTSIHPGAQPAAEAAECVRDIAGNDEAYFKYHDKIFEEQDKSGQGTVQFTTDDLKQWAQDLGYDIGNCLDNGEFTSEVLKDMVDAQAAGGSGTPYFVIVGSDGKGISLSGAQPFSAFKQIIDVELS